jgi:hypothetical protein
MSWLVSELQGKRPLLPPALPMTPEVADVINTFRMLARLPPDSLGAYIISMAHTASDVLAVVLLQKECGGGRRLLLCPCCVHAVLREGRVGRGRRGGVWVDGNWSRTATRHTSTLHVHIFPPSPTPTPTTLPTPPTLPPPPPTSPPPTHTHTHSPRAVVPALRVVPLFETLDDLVYAETAMRQLFSNEWYLNLIAGKQECMIGYSDSGKDAGRLAAAWGLYEVQEKLVKVCVCVCVCICVCARVCVRLGRGGVACRTPSSSIHPPPPYAGNPECCCTPPTSHAHAHSRSSATRPPAPIPCAGCRRVWRAPHPLPRAWGDRGARRRPRPPRRPLPAAGHHPRHHPRHRAG